MSPTWSQRIQVILASCAGAFLIYCGQSFAPSNPVLLEPNNANNMVPDVNANEGGACCGQNAPEFTVLGTYELSGTNLTSGPVNIGSYREIVLYTDYIDPADEAQQCDFTHKAFARPDGSSSFGEVGYGSNPQGALRVLGTQMKIDVTTRVDANCTSVKRITVAGIR